MTQRSRSLSALTVCLALIGASCGGDDSGSGSALSNEAFCAKLSSLDDLDPLSDDMSKLTEIVEELADVAPSAELRDAVLTLTPMMTVLAELDENDPAAMSEMMEILTDPDVVAAGESIEEFGVETCGLEPSED